VPYTVFRTNLKALENLEYTLGTCEMYLMDLQVHDTLSSSRQVRQSSPTGAQTDPSLYGQTRIQGVGCQ
jgi:hypothetical protein